MSKGELDIAIAERLFGWRWMAWLDVPERDAKGYPDKCVCRQFVSPVFMASEGWQKYWTDNGGVIEATGKEPLNYCYSSSQPPERVPSYSREDDYLVLLRVRACKNIAFQEVFARELPASYRYVRGVYSRKAIKALDDLGIEKLTEEDFA